MKILHINSNYIYTKLHQLLIDHLNNFNIDNTVFVPIRKDESLKYDNDHVLVKKCFRKIDRFFFHLKQRKIIGCAKKEFDIASYDLLHAYTLFTDGNCARTLSREYGIPYVVAVRNTDVNVFFRKRVLLRNRGVKIMEDAERVFFLSETYKELVLSKYVPAHLRSKISAKSVVISNGIDDFWLDNKYLNKRDLDKDDIRIVYAGSIDKNKNIISTIQAIQLLSNQYNITFNVVGKVLDKKEFCKIEREKNVVYYEQRPKEELIKIYRSSDIFVMPSIYESFGLVYAEAMSQGLPVLYTEGQGFDKQFSEGTVGYHVRALSPESIANGIERIVNDYETLSLNTVKYVEKFNWNAIAEHYVSIYKQIFWSDVH